MGKRGRSKSYRAGDPLDTLGLCMCEHGFSRRSLVLPDNVSEPSTLVVVLELLGNQRKCQTVIMVACVLQVGNIA